MSDTAPTVPWIVSRRESGEHAHRGGLLLGERRPRLHVVGERHLLGQPEVVHEAIPDLEVLVVLNAVPVDRLHVVDELERFGVISFLRGGSRVTACS
jgi:hypothetical protein